MAALVYQIENEDRLRWIEENRTDILHILETESPIWVGDHLVSSKTGNPIYSCPFLKWESGISTCLIYETRPTVCRSFIPGSSEICPQYKK
jgi:Fe-S-cluster containining protein